MFQGSSALSLDAKGRMTIPTRHRAVLMTEESGRLTLTRHPDGCLILYPRSTWEQKREQIAALPMSARALQRLMLGSAQDVDIDSAGRILISPELRQVASLHKNVMLLGLGAHFELWDAEQLELRQAADLAQGLPESLDHFSL
ncbi:division/cell wall cluster transcriptional repressor MraZ [Paenalcaligenes sp.]|uniref:division/cell wall cluster transcriptional repressor MraZ n=1 Tax=Paenalcaligenes sp. TaxID=1966342 RepID=UPI00262AC517|nr:division/cell wall cluster transcriptional repressor MraZ [Paenalcaligenes sp.]